MSALLRDRVGKIGVAAPRPFRWTEIYLFAREEKARRGFDAPMVRRAGCMRGFIVHPHRRTDGLREPVDAHLSQKLVLGEAASAIAAALAPAAPLFHDPSRKSDR